VVLRSVEGGELGDVDVEASVGREWYLASPLTLLLPATATSPLVTPVTVGSSRPNGSEVEVLGRSSGTNSGDFIDSISGIVGSGDQMV
jgi:hypothetical protein